MTHCNNLMSKFSKTATIQSILFVVAISIAGISIAQESDKSAPSHGFTKKQRIELAKKLLEPIRKKAMADLKSPERMHFFTDHWAAIDPAWTAKFMAENPVPQDSNDENYILYDNKAIRIVMASPAEVAQDDLIKLIQMNQNFFVGTSYAAVALENLPEGKSEFKDKIIKAATPSSPPKMTSPMGFAGRFKLAELADDSMMLEKVNKEIAQYYESGAAMKAWKQLKKQQHFAVNGAYYSSMFAKYAPDSMKKDFFAGGKPQSKLSGFEAQMLIQDDSMSKIEKTKKLNTFSGVDFGKQPYDQMTAASMLGSVARVDHKLALKWADSAPSERAKIWAKIMIAPSVAKNDLASAKTMVTQCYDEILQLDLSDRVSSNYNFSPASLAGRGLRLAAMVDPALLDDCIDKTTEAMKGLESSRMHSAKDHIFQVIAAIAPYDKAKANSLMEKYEDDVPLTSSAAFFRALIALRPDQVFDEYQNMPAKDDRGTDYRIYVRNEIIPALTAKTDQDFWDALNNKSLGQVGFLRF